ncbi:Protein of unknown function [Pyronema omphalodes CBS 100304]|uniref:Uncharacterized protein n=1 Tax=Pyronema omphalodes (strain CBS 100304) TaxID=1076935 RepID=U4L0P4_PYROM|nr:Protein of unknown function [Pyronema omphalodes CBS 100304]
MIACPLASSGSRSDIDVLGAFHEPYSRRRLSPFLFAALNTIVRVQSLDRLVPNPVPFAGI